MQVAVAMRVLKWLPIEDVEKQLQTSLLSESEQSEPYMSSSESGSVMTYKVNTLTSATHNYLSSFLTIKGSSANMEPRQATLVLWSLLHNYVKWLLTEKIMKTNLIAWLQKLR